MKNCVGEYGSAALPDGKLAGYQLHVGSYPAGASPDGVLDMAGNVLEWVNDWYQADYYSVSPAVNPQGPATGYTRVTRGGGYGNYTTFVRVAVRDINYSADRNYASLGFRCARSQ